MKNLVRVGIVFIFLLSIAHIFKSNASSNEIFSKISSYKWESKGRLIGVGDDGSVALLVSEDSSTTVRCYKFLDKEGKTIWETEFVPDEKLRFKGPKEYPKNVFGQDFLIPTGNIIYLIHGRRDKPLQDYSGAFMGSIDKSNKSIDVNRIYFGTNTYVGQLSNMSYDGKYFVFTQMGRYWNLINLYVFTEEDYHEYLLNISEIRNSSGSIISRIHGEVQLSDDGNYFVAQSTNGVSLYKITGEKLWTKKVNGIIKISQDGKYVVVGECVRLKDGERSWDPKAKRPWVYLFDRDGNMLWRKHIDSDDTFAIRVEMSPSGKYIVASEGGEDDPSIDEGPTYCQGYSGSLFLYDIQGNLLYRYRGEKPEEVSSTTRRSFTHFYVNDKGTVFAEYETDSGKVFFVLLNVEGKELWKEQVLNSQQMVKRYEIETSKNGKYAVVSYEHLRNNKVYFFDHSEFADKTSDIPGGIEK